MKVPSSHGWLRTSAGQLKDKPEEKRKMKITSGHFTLTKWMPGLSPVALVLPSLRLVSEP